MRTNGVQGCCVDLSCTAFEPDTFTITPISVPSITFTPVSITPISNTPISIPKIVPPTPVGVDDRSSYGYYTTTWIWYYYSYFLTTIPPSYTTPTSTEVTTTINTFSVYATDIEDASSQFESLTVGLTLPAAVTASDYASGVAALTATSSSASTLRVGGLSTGTASSGNSEAGASGGVKGDGGFGMLLLGSCLAIGMGMLAIWL